MGKLTASDNFAKRQLSYLLAFCGFPTTRKLPVKQAAFTRLRAEKMAHAMLHASGRALPMLLACLGGASAHVAMTYVQNQIGPIRNAASATGNGAGGLVSEGRDER